MPATPYSVAIIAVLVAAVFTAWAARRSYTRSSEVLATAAEDRYALGVTRSELGQTRTELTETRSDLAAAHSRVDQLTEQLRQTQTQLEAALVPAARPDGRYVEVFVNLSRRLQSLVHREIKLLDALENEVEDPDLLKGLFQVDHLATRTRRHAENLAVLGGSVSRRQWSRPVALTEVLRSAIAEVEHYSRVKLVPPIEGTVPGHAVASVVHLIAELIENATMFAPPHTQVLLRAQQVAAGVAIEVEDRGLGMQSADQERVNQLLAKPSAIDLADLLRDGRIGLYVVSVIARQYGIVVQLQANIYGGTQAVVILPQVLIGSKPEEQVVPARPQSLAHLQDRPHLRPTSGASAPGQPAQPAQPAQARTDEFPRAVPMRVIGSSAVPRQAADGAPSETVHPTPSRPPLPRRRSQSHMAPQLQSGPPRTPTEPAGEHDPRLMASFMNGISQGEQDAPYADELG